MCVEEIGLPLTILYRSAHKAAMAPTLHGCHGQSSENNSTCDDHTEAVSNKHRFGILAYLCFLLKCGV